MGMTFIAERSFDKINFTEIDLLKGEYDQCTFTNCNFSNVNLSEFIFSECGFFGCNLSLAQLGKTAFQHIEFKECKLLGLRFDTCDSFGFSVRFDQCMLNHASFFHSNLKKTNFINSQLIEVDFTECNMTGAIFDDCNLDRAVFSNTNLEKANFRTAYNYSIDPEMNKIKKAMFSLLGISGLLNKYEIEIDPH